METGTFGKKVNEREIVAGVKVIETEYRVQRPIFEDVIIEKPVYANKQIEVPVGIEKTLDSMAVILYERIMEKISATLDKKLADAIDKRIKEIEVPEIIYKKEEKIISVEVPVFKDIEIERPVFKDREILNPILKDVEVTNAVLKDIEVEKPVFKERVVIQPIFEEVVIEKPKFIQKEITVISPKYIDMKGNPE